ncbi:MAG: hypothetical protein EHM67_08415 [Hyphomicrobiaceae bacterium]|nr:MAG: hypothetical protein EHM67_08415 [Hyphomicrobiaceae bacterium]
MEIAELLGRTPREALATMTYREFVGYAKLGADRSDEYEDNEPGIDVSEMQPGAIASMFGAEIV